MTNLLPPAVTFLVTRPKLEIDFHYWDSQYVARNLRQLSIVTLEYPIVCTQSASWERRNRLLSFVHVASMRGAMD